MNNSLLIFLVSVFVVSIYFDTRRGIIPNAVTMPAFFIMFLIGYFEGGIGLLKIQFFGALAAWVVWWIIWSVRMVGGGDQKLMAVVGAAVGWPLIVPAMLSVGVIGGILALVWLFVSRIRGDWQGLRHALKSVSVPYSLAIALGTVFVIVLTKFGFNMAEWW